MHTNTPDIKTSDLKAAFDFLTGGTRDEATTPVRKKRMSNTVRPVVAVHHGINRDRIRAVKVAE